MVAGNYGYNSFTSSYLASSGYGATTTASTATVRPHQTANRFHTSNVTNHKFYTEGMDQYVAAARSFNTNGRSQTMASGVPSSGYQYKVMGQAQISNHQSLLAAAYAEQAQVDAERQLKLQQAAENDRLKAQQQAQTQGSAGGQQYQDNTMKYVQAGIQIASLFF